MAFWPTGLNTTTLEVSWYGKDWAPAEKPDAWDLYPSFFNDVVAEDTQFGNWIQKSVESYAYDGVPLSYQEARIYHWHQAIDAIIGVERIPQPLRVAPVIDERLALSARYRAPSAVGVIIELNAKNSV